MTTTTSTTSTTTSPTTGTTTSPATGPVPPAAAAGDAATTPRASRGDGTYPRPQLVRPSWADLCGPWDFALDPQDAGRDAGWWRPGGPDGADPFDRTIQVPFPPEAPDSGIGDPGPLRVVWYRRRLTAEDLAAAGLGRQGDRVVLHLGAVDHTADVWVDGQHVGRHEGGQTPFALDVTAAVGGSGEGDVGTGAVVVVRAEDDPDDVVQPRGKQDWKPSSHSIWYDRTTGIWQPVWLEAVPALALEELAWEADLPRAAAVLTARLSSPPVPGTWLDVVVRHDEDVLAEQRVRVLGRDVHVVVDLPRQANGQGYEELLWSPERPTLLDATLTLSAPGGSPDVVASYLGLRSCAVAAGAFLLNDRPYRLRSVLEQGYWPGTHLAAPSADALRQEVQLIKDLGFNAARVHQKAEDPRFLFWADRLGLTVWGETANAYAYSPRSVELLTREWLELVRRDRSHPSIITWVPLNESWGVQHGAHDVAQQHYGLGLAHLTRALDPTRPVVSNDGWEHTDSDIWTVHDYAERGDELRARYGTPEAVDRLLAGIGPAGRRLRLADAAPTHDRGQPVMLTEFGGVSYAAERHDAWGYSTATSDEDFAARIGDLLAAAREAAPLAGFCWTQLTDTGQETNGLLRADRSPKLPVAVLRRLVTGVDEGAARPSGDVADPSV
ncbi:glycoside hydrolase family 2 protein [Cellulomonas marina]|uniref:Glycosyl hydrolases family 2, sugar binding domain n=1 Tax=Cellulomonas marina TaxID=988821 RepID=A0A1I0Y0Y9_9CELL|nr:glycoside hydrolase family 2 TIM barrel-domain containing protein [Cellulomonas marina]GIG28415.1 beta-glucuronidase [Cellulomonas marina]SFB06834.1 Glycosyl hydrolases family 2, sugar binding domain [Cellulomonas marina]